MNEVDVQNLLAHHPYLIHKRLEGLIPLREFSKGIHRLDLAFETKAGLSIVELKKVSLTRLHLSQLLRYCRAWSYSKKKPLAPDHYLIGKKPKDPTILEMAVARCKRNIHLIYLGEQIPSYLMMQKRRYVPYDPDVYSSNIVHVKV